MSRGSLFTSGTKTRFDLPRTKQGKPSDPLRYLIPHNQRNLGLWSARIASWLAMAKLRLLRLVCAALFFRMQGARRVD